MAVQAVVITKANPDDYNNHVATWGLPGTPLANGDSGAPIMMPGSADRSYQVTGTFGAGGSVQMEGSNDVVALGAVPTNWFLLSTPQGTTSARTTAGIIQIEEATLWVRPRVTVGDGTTSLSVNLFLKKVA